MAPQTIQLRRDIAANWTAANSILHNGELGIETDTKKGKLGDGVTAWNSLAYWTPGGAAGLNPPAGDIGGTATNPTVISTHLSSPLPVAQGGTGVATAPAGQVFAGPVSGAAAPPGFRVLTATDIPSYTTTFTFGSTGAAPSSGTYSTGQILIDQNGLVRVCTAGGSPGTWMRAGASPWQFFVDDYGAVGNGRQLLVNTTNANATITSTPLAAPAAPTVSNATTGGTVLAGTYGVIVTYVNAFGETVGSTASTTTTTGSTSTITINSPNPSGNAVSWYAYVTLAGGSTYYRQQTAGSPTAIEVPLILTTPPTNTGLNPPGSDSSATPAFTSTAVDGGKNIMICGAQGSPGGPAIDTIATVISPTQATITTAANITATVTGCPMVFSTDDRLAIDFCVTAARAYAVSHRNFAQVFFSEKIYGMGSGLFQSTAPNGAANQNPATLAYNTQLRIPVGNQSGQTEKLEIQFLAPGDNSHARFWVSQYVNLNGCNLVSYSIGPNSAPDPVYGQQSIMGGPQGGMNFNGSNAFGNVNVVIRGIAVIQPGWSNSIGIDLQWIGGCTVTGRSGVFAPGITGPGVVNPCFNWVSQTFWQQNKIGTGIRLPNEQNNAQVILESFDVEGLNRGVSTQCDHAVIRRLVSDSMYDVVYITAGDVNAHELRIDEWSFSNTQGAAINVLGGVHFAVEIIMDGEQSAIGFDVKDNGNALYGTIKWFDPFRTAGGLANVQAPVVSGAANVNIVNRQIVRQIYDLHAANYTLGTAFQNPLFKDSMVNLSGGAVTGISIGPTASSLTALGLGSPSIFRLPSGWWIQINGTTKPTTFQMIPD